MRSLARSVRSMPKDQRVAVLHTLAGCCPAGKTLDELANWTPKQLRRAQAIIRLAQRRNSATAQQIVTRTLEELEKEIAERVGRGQIVPPRLEDLPVPKEHPETD